MFSLTDNPFVGLPLATLLTYQQKYLQVLTDIANTGVSYAFPGLSLTRADIDKVLGLLSAIRVAIGATPGSGGNVKQIAYATIDTQQQFDP